MTWNFFVRVQFVLFTILFKQAPLMKAPSSPEWHLMHQTGYDILLHRVEIGAVNKSYIKDFRGGYVLYNRTQRVFNYSMQLLRDIKTMKLSLQTFKMASNVYRLFPLVLTLDMCREYYLNSFGLKDTLDNASNFRGCPIAKGQLYFKNVMFDYSTFPPYIPFGDYKGIHTLKEKEYLIMEILIYGKIYGKSVN